MTGSSSEGEKNKNHLADNHFFKAMNSFFQNPPMKEFIGGFDDFFAGGGFPVEMNETEQHYIVTAKLAGVKKEQIKIDLLNQSLMITVHHHEKKVAEAPGKALAHQENRRHNTRTISFMRPINHKKVKATYEDGLLKVLVDKLKSNSIQID